MKEDQRVALTKRLLQEGLFRLLEKKEMDSIHVSELCAESGINRATFYRHYGQPRDILKNLRFTIFHDVQELALQTRAEDHLSGWLEALCQYSYDHAELLRVLFRTRTDDEFVEAIQASYQEQLSNPHFQAAVRQDDKGAKLMAYCFAGGFYYLLRQWILEPIDQSPKEVAAVMHRFLSGVENLKTQGA